MSARYAPGQWVPIRIPTGAVSAQIAFGGTYPRPAYIENVRGRRGVETYAKLRCPNLRPGRHAVRVITDDEVTETSIDVV